MQKMLTRLDEVLYLQGDEDGDVSVQCRLEDRGGLPVIFYTTDTRTTAYHSSDVVMVYTMTALINACIDHCDSHNTKT